MRIASLERLQRLLTKLPGVGEKTALRYVLRLLEQDGSLARDLAAELAALPDRVGRCATCGHLAENDGAVPLTCGVCRDDRRDAALLCVVARVPDVLALERAGAYRGRYHVLGRLLSPLDGVGPEELGIDRLLARARADGVREVVIATPPTVDGEATALLLKRELEALGVTVSRIASGLPHGGELEFADPITLGRALAGRRAL
jgi:recombination protein RecR